MHQENLSYIVSVYIDETSKTDINSGINVSGNLLDPYSGKQVQEDIQVTFGGKSDLCENPQDGNGKEGFGFYNAVISTVIGTKNNKKGYLVIGKVTDDVFKNIMKHIGTETNSMIETIENNKEIFD